MCHLQHKLTGFYNRDEKCLQRGTNWVFKESSLRFVFKGLITLRLKLDIHGSVHHNTNLIEMTNKIQLCRTIYYSIVP